MTKINNSPRIPLDEFKVMKGVIAHLRSYDDKWRAARGLAPRPERPTLTAPAQASTQTSAPAQTETQQAQPQTVPAQTTPTMSDIIRTTIMGDGMANATLNPNVNPAPTAPAPAPTVDDLAVLLSNPTIKAFINDIIANLMPSPSQIPVQTPAETVPAEETTVDETSTETAPTEESTVEEEHTTIEESVDEEPVVEKCPPTEETVIEETATEEGPVEETPVETPAQPEIQPEQTTPLIAYYKEKLEEYKKGSQKMNEAPVEEKAEEETKAEEKPAPKKSGKGGRSKK